MSVIDELRAEISALAERLVRDGEAAGVVIATAESCTGGLIAGALTDVAGSSSVFDRGFVTYSNQAKMDMLGVRPGTLEAFGAVSSPTAAEMASGALRNSGATLAVSVTGIAGPGGGSKDKPVGLVFMGLAGRDHVTSTVELRFPQTASRAIIRLMTVRAALTALTERLPA